MKNHWAIAVGINRYEDVSPSLSYAQADAQALQEFFIRETGTPSEQCILLTETSPPICGQSTYPSRENIQGWVEDICRNQLKPGDVFWYFFSGYGINSQGKDYLMPIEGDPLHISTTGIPVQSLLESIRAAQAELALVFLDMHHSQWGAQTGQQTIELASRLKLATILACQPDGFSHEAAMLRHGFFTAALLEVLRRDRNPTIDGLGHYLGQRVPELSRQYSRPEQTPVMIYPPEKMHQSIFSRNGSVPPSQDWSGGKPGGGVTTVLQREEALVGTGGRQGQSGGQGMTAVATDREDGHETAENARLTTDTTNSQANSEESDGATLLLKPWFWLAVGLLLTVLVVLMNPGVFRRQGNSPSGDPSAPADAGNSTVPNPDNSGSAEGSGAAPTNASATDARSSGASLLDDAKMAVSPIQASYYFQAIKQARQVPKDDPRYKEAQANIERWNAMIVDIAQGRAQQGNFVGAIAAARLVSQDRKAYKAVKADLSQWQQQAQLQQANLKVLQQATQVIRPSQASSYNQAIGIARRIEPGQPGYVQANDAIATWSLAIYKLAHSRAQQKDWPAAIAAGRLIPPGTPAYDAAQDALDRWQSLSQE